MNETDSDLDTELRTFEQHKEDLLKRSEGKFALISQDRLIGVYDTKLAAIAVGHDLIGPQPFLVKRIERVESPVRILLLKRN